MSTGLGSCSLFSDSPGVELNYKYLSYDSEFRLYFLILNRNMLF